MSAQTGDARRGSPAALRRMNVERVLETLRHSGTLSQAELARQAGLSRSAVNALVRSLVADGTVILSPGQNGRESAVSLAAASGTVVALDVGHQHVHAALFSFADGIRHDDAVDIVQTDDPTADIERIVELVHRLLASAATDAADVRGVCVALRTPYEAASRTVSGSGIWHRWRGFDIETALTTRLELPISIDNDSNLAALAEWTWGDAHGQDGLLYVNCSNGIGAGYILGGRVYGGTHGLASEFGHLVVDDRGALCNCGNGGCLNAVASARAIRLKLAAAGDPRASILDVIAAARAGNLPCRRLLGESGRAIGFALAHAVKLMDPSVIVVGGDLTASGPMLLEPMRAELSANVLETVAGPPEIRRGIQRSDVSLLGCVARVLAETGTGMSELAPWMLMPTAPAKEKA